MTWGTWPDPLIDFGRELYTAWQLSKGARLYADLAYFNGPLSPHLNAALFKLFGVGLHTLVVANTVLLAATTMLLYCLLKRLTSRFSATVACLTFLFFFAFGQFLSIGNYNFITPYSHELTHGILFALLALMVFDRYQSSGRRCWAAALGFCCGLTLLTKPEVAAASLCSIFAGLAAAGRLHRSSLKVWLTAALAMALPPALAWLLLRWQMDAMLAWEGILGAWKWLFNRQLASSLFYRHILGTDDIAGNCLRMGFSAAGYLAAVLSAIYCNRLLGGIRHSRLGKPAAWVAAAAVFAAAFQARHFFWALFFSDLLRPLPLVLGMVIGVAWLQLGQTANGMERHRLLCLQLAFSVFALVLLGKMILNVRVFHYGFALAMPASVLAIALLFHQRGVFRPALLGLWGVFILGALTVSQLRIAEKPVIVGRGADRFFSDERGKALNSVLQMLESQLTATESVAVLPEGVMINYLLRRDNPTGFINFMPVEMAMFGEPRMLQAFQRRPPDYIVLVHKDTAEYGPRFFGRDYGLLIYDWIQKHYRSVYQAGAAPLKGEAFGIQVMRLR